MCIRDRNYIEYLESANLIYQSWPVNMGGKKVLKASPKIYIADAAIRNAVLMDDSMPVSYTHLDVYKRQEMVHSFEFIRSRGRR